MNFDGLEVTSTSIAGFSVLPEKELLIKIIQNPDFSGLGDFVFTIEGQLHTKPVNIVYATEVAAIPWYYICRNMQFYHGANVFDVWKKCGGNWEWNETALYAINNLDHSVGDHTIHKNIKRVPANSTLIYFNNELKIIKRKDTLKNRVPLIKIDEAIHNFSLLLKDYLSDNNKNYFLSLSAGFDSRLLLAAMLKFNKRPLMATMGNEDCTDVKIASHIAKDFDLQHEQYALQTSDYFDQQKIETIIKLTSGTKPMRHWHTFFYIENFKFLNNTIHFAGSNGELIRSYYFDKGIIAKMLNITGDFPFQFAIKQKLNRGDKVVIDSLKNNRNKNAVTEIFLSEAPELKFMDRLSYSYCYERVRHFTGKGMALYNHALPTASPFLDTRFLEIKRSLPSKFTLNNLFHKYCINEFCPELMNYAFSENSDNIRNFNSNSYFFKNPVYKDYNMAKYLIKEEPVKNIIFESRYLDAWLTRDNRKDIWLQQNERTISFLVTLHYTSALIHKMQ